MTTETASAEYRPFPDVRRRNLLQEALELPALIVLLRLPRGGSILESAVVKALHSRRLPGC